MQVNFFSWKRNIHQRTNQNFRPDQTLDNLYFSQFCKTIFLVTKFCKGNLFTNLLVLNNIFFLFKITVKTTNVKMEHLPKEMTCF